MKLSKIVELIHGEKVYISDDSMLEKEFKYGFASDLMSDVLSMISSNSDTTLLLTGLANIQSLRTAEMLDINTVILVRGKSLNEETLALGKECNINLITSGLSMFETCGVLYKAGLDPIEKSSK
ncbi:MAG: hypothetical protein RSF69_00270 [Erysipelotrichaceae bacterium]